MRLLTAFIPLLLAGCAGFTPTATDPEGVMREVATKMGTDRCVSQAMQWGDRNGDGRLSQAEWEDMTQIALRGMVRFKKLELQSHLEYWRRSGDASDERRRELEAEIAEFEARVEPQRKWARERFAASDTDRDGMLSAGELADTCEELGAS